MKQFLIATLLVFFLCSSAEATVQVYEQHILFSLGLDSIKLSKKRVGEDINEVIVLSGENINQLELNNKSFKLVEEKEIWVSPGLPNMNSYEFWQVTGANNGKKFIILGYTIEKGGDTWTERNSFTIDLLFTILLGLLASAGIVLYQNNQS